MLVPSAVGVKARPYWHLGSASGSTPAPLLGARHLKCSKHHPHQVRSDQYRNLQYELVAIGNTREPAPPGLLSDE